GGAGGCLTGGGAPPVATVAGPPPDVPPLARMADDPAAAATGSSALTAVEASFIEGWVPVPGSAASLLEIALETCVSKPLLICFFPFINRAPPIRSDRRRQLSSTPSGEAQPFPKPGRP